MGARREVVSAVAERYRGLPVANTKALEIAVSEAPDPRPVSKPCFSSRIHSASMIFG
jgi:hypothetical protein